MPHTKLSGILLKRIKDNPIAIMTSSSSLESAPLSSFTCFPNLPTEVRERVWSFVHILTPSTFIRLYLCSSDLHYLLLKRTRYYTVPWVLAAQIERVPTILHVCRESREVGRRCYSLDFAKEELSGLGKPETDIEERARDSRKGSISEVDTAVYWFVFKGTAMFYHIEWMDKISVAHAWYEKAAFQFGRSVCSRLTVMYV